MRPGVQSFPVVHRLPPSLKRKCTTFPNDTIPVGAAAGCDLLILIFKSKIKRSQPAAAPTKDTIEPFQQESAPC
ncbi:hypothetical protein PG5_24930 [Pseudomonas sp. G5(2012)]|nr:hypothetical protein PG5_24930 [Pseudomonas sp. G5(2012)]